MDIVPEPAKNKVGLELKMHPGKTRGVPGRLRQNETCGLCALEGNWFHVCSMCKHPDMRDFYTVRHNAVGRTLLHAMHETGQAGAVAHPDKLWEGG